MERGQELAGQTVLVIGGSSGIGLETARVAHERGAQVIITARDPERVQRAGLEFGGSIAAFDATDFPRLGRFFEALQTPIDHILVSGPRPAVVPLGEFGVDEARRDLEAHLLLPLQVTREAASKIRPGGTLLFIGCIDGSHADTGLAFVSAITAALSAMTKSLASELAPTRVNVLAAGFVDTQESGTATFADRQDERRDQLETILPIRRVVAPGDVAHFAVHLMTNTAVTGGTFEIDGGQQLVER
jgi:NAD(P)-dependent dehydrogenase (short-subunit alcohol dehydrogenase family)